ncbi:MAG: hypothetical protein EZS28_039371, partial [Streblomastix strix]
MHIRIIAFAEEDDQDGKKRSRWLDWGKLGDCPDSADSNAADSQQKSNSPLLRRILPSYFTDNYFFLMPGESKAVRLDFERALLGSSGRLKLRIEGVNVIPFYISGKSTYEQNDVRHEMNNKKTEGIQRENTADSSKVEQDEQEITEEDLREELVWLAGQMRGAKNPKKIRELLVSTINILAQISESTLAVRSSGLTLTVCDLLVQNDNIDIKALCRSVLALIAGREGETAKESCWHGIFAMLIEMIHSVDEGVSNQAESGFQSIIRKSQEALKALAQSTILLTASQAVISESVTIHVKSNLLSVVNQIVSQWEFITQKEISEAPGAKELIQSLQRLGEIGKDVGGELERKWKGLLLLLQWKIDQQIDISKIGKDKEKKNEMKNQSPLIQTNQNVKSQNFPPPPQNILPAVQPQIQKSQPIQSAIPQQVQSIEQQIHIFQPTSTSSPQSIISQSLFPLPPPPPSQQ